MIFDQLNSILWIVPCLLAVLLLAFVVVFVPLRIWKKQSFSADCSREIIDPHELPPAVDRYFLQMTPSMAALGFVVTAYLRDSEMLRGYEMYLAHWTNRACGQSAALIVLSGPAGIVARATSMQFKTRLANGTTVVTDNSNQARILVFEQDYHLLQFPDVDDPAELYQLHLWHEERRLDPKLPRFLPAEQKLLDNMKREIKRTFSTQVAAGRMKERNGRYHHTLENAFRLTWKHLPPFRQIAKARTTLKANRIKRQALNGTLRRPLPVITTDVQLVGSSD